MSELANSKNPYPTLPDSLRHSLKKDEYAIFRLLGVYREDGKFCGRDHLLPSRDIIADKDGKVYPIAYIKNLNPDGTPELGEIMFRMDSNCQIVLRSGAKDASAYEYMMNTNFNVSNQNRDTSAAKIFENVETSTGAKEVRNKRGDVVKAISLAQAMTDDEVLRFCAKNQPRYPILKMATLPDGKHDFEEMRNFLELFAEKDSAKFLACDEVTAKTEAPTSETDLIAYARKAEIIDLDRETKQWYNVKTGRAILKVKSVVGPKPVDDLAVWLLTKEGKKVYDLITTSKADADKDKAE